MNQRTVDIASEKHHSQGNNTAARLGCSCKIGRILAIGMLLIPVSRMQAAEPRDTGKPRVIVMTDIGGDPDDQQSLVRFLVYANEFDVEGLIATTSGWKNKELHPGIIREWVEAYGLVRHNLIKHAPGYPSEQHLLNVTKAGRAASGMVAVGAGKSSEGSNHIIRVVDTPDPRPVWICIWGGASDLAQALYDVNDTRSESDIEAFVSKLRVYDLAGQDDAGAWICRTFPTLFWIRSQDQWRGISHRIDNNGKKWQATRGGNESWAYGRTTYHDSLFAPVFRWRQAFQHDFAARMDWTVTDSYDKANHNPIAAFQGNTSKDMLELSVSPGELIELSAVGSRDPDGDTLSYKWWQYPEPGSFGGLVKIRDSTTCDASFIAPSVSVPKTIHAILTVEDDGHPSRSSYRRIVVAVKPR